MMISLKNIEEFRKSPELLHKLEEYGILKEFEAGKVLLNENSPIRSIPIVINGLLKVSKTEEDGKEIFLYFIKPGESCIMSFLGGLHNERSKVSAIAEEDSEILFLPVDKVSLFVKEFPQWVDYIFRLYHKRFEDLLEVVNAIAFKKVDERLLDLLKKLSEMNLSDTILITHEQLANKLGTARVVVSRLLKKLEEDGMVQLGRNKIVLVNSNYKIDVKS
ncbi:MAG TPA: Crp/Fnr family transcriptional regulator [Edaphocola sp.]|nr:Crp/Fnr family transcriptional regulator [Edaphocola sp.]